MQQTSVVLFTKLVNRKCKYEWNIHVRLTGKLHCLSLKRDVFNISVGAWKVGAGEKRAQKQLKLVGMY